MAEPVCSVIVPVYNTESYLPACLDSMAAQTFPDFEVLIINDGSTDGSENICREYAARDSRFRLFSRENRGVSAARNLGLENARGQYVMFLDSDDRVSPDFVKDAVEAFEQGNPDIVLFNYYECRTLENLVLEEIYDCGTLDIRRYLLRMARSPIDNYYGMLCNKAFRMDHIRQLKLTYDTSLCYGEDFRFLMQYLAVSETVATIRPCNYFYTYDRPGSLSKGNPDPYLHADQLAEAYASYLALWKAKGLYRRYKPLVQYFGARMYFEWRNACPAADTEYIRYLTCRCLTDNGFSGADILFFQCIRVARKAARHLLVRKDNT